MSTCIFDFMIRKYFSRDKQTYFDRMYSALDMFRETPLFCIKKMQWPPSSTLVNVLVVVSNFEAYFLRAMQLFDKNSFNTS